MAIRPTLLFTASAAVLLQCCLLQIPSSVLSSPSSLSKEVERGLKAGDALLTALETPQGAQNVTPVLAELALPFIIALSLMVQRAQSTVNEMEKRDLVSLLTHYNTRLRMMSSEYSEVRDLVDWSSVSLSFGQYERSIMALKENLMQVLQAPKTSQEGQKLFFCKVFQHDYNNAATKLYQAMLNDDRLFSDNLVGAVRKYTKSHRGLTQQFSMGVYKLIMEGIELEATYLTFSNLSSNVEYVRTYWEQRLKQLQEAIQNTDLQIRADWQTQADQDISNFNHQSAPATGLKEYAESLYQMLKTKFEWREWMVLAYDPVGTYHYHANLDCPQTFIRYRQDGKNLIVSSVDKANSTFTKAMAEMVLSHLPANSPSYQSQKPLYFLSQMLGKMGRKEQETICEDNAISYMGVLEGNVNHHLVADASHYVYKMHSAKAVVYTYKFKIFIFG